jgi:transcriptional antiterminator NusG
VIDLGENLTDNPIFAVRTTAGQERNASWMVETKAKVNNLPIIAVLAPETLRGYIFIEAGSPHIVEEAISGIRHIRSRVPGKTEISEVERYLMTKPVIEELEEGYTVEIISGPFKGMKAHITRVNKVKQEVTLELLEATFTLPITVHADYVKVVEKTAPLR